MLIIKHETHLLIRPISCLVSIRNLLHALCCLTGNVDQLDHLKLGLDDVKVMIKTGTFTPLRDNSQLRFSGVAHEEQDVDMSGFPENQTKCKKLVG